MTDSPLNENEVVCILDVLRPLCIQGHEQVLARIDVVWQDKWGYGARVHAQQ